MNIAVSPSSIRHPTVLRVVLLGSAVVLLVSLFLPWYAASAHAGALTGGSGTISATANAWDAFSSIQVLLCLFAIFVAGVAGWEFYTSSPSGAQLRRSAILPLLAALAAALSALLTVIHLFDIPSQSAAASFGVSISLSYGIFIALLAALVGTVAAVLLSIDARSLEGGGNLPLARIRVGRTS